MKKLSLLTALIFLGLYGNAQCLADVNIVAGNSTGEFEFTSTSSGTHQYLDFGDGASISTSTGSVEYHTYNATGIYNVCIIVSDVDTTGNLICTDTLCTTVNVTGLTSCSSGFNAWQGVDTAGNSGPVLWVTNLSSTQSGGTLSYLWDFGDGSTSTAQFPTHVYSQLGTYTLCLTIDDGMGCTDTYCETILVTHKAVGFTLMVIEQDVLSTFELSDQMMEVVLFPNPTEGFANLKISSPEVSEIKTTILDISGQVMLQELFQINEGGNLIQLDTDELSNGYYFLNISSDDKLLKTIQFIKK